MEKKSNHIFSYPPNLQELDLATLVNLYRERGEVLKALDGKLRGLRNHKKTAEGGQIVVWSFLQPGRLGLSPYKKLGRLSINGSRNERPGLVYSNRKEPPHREFVEKNIGTLPKLAYLIINDIKQFGFIKEDEGVF